MPNVKLTFNAGINTSEDPSLLQQGEMVSGVGIYYQPGDTQRAHVLPGRSTFGDTGTSAGSKGLYLARYDTGGTDRLLTYNGSGIYSATPGVTGTYTQLISGLSSSATVFGGVHWNDRNYVYNGVNSNYIIESGGSTLTMGMTSPQDPLTVVSGVAGSTNRGTAHSFPVGSWDYPANSYNGVDDTLFSKSTMNTPGDRNTILISGWASNTDTDRILYAKFRLAGYQHENVDPDEGLPGGPVDGGDVGVGGETTGNFDTSFNFLLSTDGGGTFTSIYSETRTSAHNTSIWIAHEIPDAINSSGIQLKVRHDYISGDGTATLRLYDTKISNGPTTTITTTSDMIYAITEFDAARNLESPIGPSSNGITLTNSPAAVSVPLPSATQNSNTTHFRVYRTAEGGTSPQNLGLVGQTVSTSSRYVDLFEITTTTQPSPPYAMIAITEDGGSLYIPRDSPPPVLKHLNIFKGSLVGVSAASPRDLRYSYPGFPNSWPEINLIRGFPFLERDELVATATVGDYLMIFAKDNIATTTKLPQFIDGRFDATDITPLRGQPGTISSKAVTTYSIAGEPRVAWVSRFGLHITDGNSGNRISDDIDWDNTVNESTLDSAVLFFDEKRQLLLFSFDSTGNSVNDKYLMFHMAPEHRKQNGRPKVTEGRASIADMVAGFVGGVYRTYTGHGSNGKVYLDWNGFSDASNTLDASGNMPIIITTPKLYADNMLISILGANLRTTDFGSGQTASVVWTAGKDNPYQERNLTKSVSLQGHRGQTLSIMRAGEWHQVSITRNAQTNGAFIVLHAEAKTDGEIGNIGSCS